MTTRTAPRHTLAPPSTAPMAPNTVSAAVDEARTTVSLRTTGTQALACLCRPGVRRPSPPPQEMASTHAARGAAVHELMPQTRRARAGCCFVSSAALPAVCGTLMDFHQRFRWIAQRFCQKSRGEEIANHLVMWSEMKADERSGMAAPTEKEMAEVMHASHGLARSSKSMPSSSRACASITAPAPQQQAQSDHHPLQPRILAPWPRGRWLPQQSGPKPDACSTGEV